MPGRRFELRTLADLVHLPGEPRARALDRSSRPLVFVGALGSAIVARLQVVGALGVVSVERDRHDPAAALERGRVPPMIRQEVLDRCQQKRPEPADPRSHAIQVLPLDQPREVFLRQIECRLGVVAGPEDECAPGISANLSGRVNVDYHWIKLLGGSHFGSVAVALMLVWLMASLNMRSMVAGVITVIPVAFSVLLIYAVMGFNGIWLAIGTSMFAAIAIGLGVDFAVHTIERLKVLIRDQQYFFDDAIAILYPSTGRALLFNFAALVLGFGVLTTSEVVPLIKFGALVAVGITSSFIASMTILPALIKAIHPAFLYTDKSKVATTKMIELDVNQKERNHETQTKSI